MTNEAMNTYDWKRTYIEIVGPLVGRPRLFRRRKACFVGRVGLSEFDLREIGEFRRNNVARWMGTHGSPDWVELLPAQDFHAVCGDNEIPWAKEESKQRFARAMKEAGLAVEWRSFGWGKKGGERI